MDIIERSTARTTRRVVSLNAAFVVMASIVHPTALKGKGVFTL